MSLLIFRNYFSFNGFSPRLLFWLFVWIVSFTLEAFLEIFCDSWLCAHVYEQALNTDARLCVGEAGLSVCRICWWAIRQGPVILWNSQLSHCLDISSVGLITFPSEESLNKIWVMTLLVKSFLTHWMFFCILVLCIFYQFLMQHL